MSLDTSSILRFAAGLRQMPTMLGSRIAAKAAPVISDFASESFAASEDPYGAPWAPAKDGSTVTLDKSGALKAYIRYVPIGTRLRVALGVPYAKYQIGLRPVYPRPGVLPARYSQALAQVAQDETRAFIGSV